MSAISHKVNTPNDLVNDYLGGLFRFPYLPRFIQSQLPVET